MARMTLFVSTETGLVEQVVVTGCDNPEVEQFNGLYAEFGARVLAIASDIEVEIR